MKKNFIIVAAGLVMLFSIVLTSVSCYKRLAETEAFAVIDKFAVNFGNDRIFNEVTLSNTGEKLLNYQVDEQIDWLEISNPTGSVTGRSEVEIICKVNRSGLYQNNYTGKFYLFTGTGNFTIDVFMMVDMHLVTFINPVFSTIRLQIDTIFPSPDTNLFLINVGKNDSAQFGFFTLPESITYLAKTSGRYTDSTQLGLEMKWEGQKFLNGQENIRLFLDISKAYFHLSIINNNQVLNPIYVNAGTSFEFLENIFVYQSSNALPVGYYHALQNTLIRAYVAGSSSTITWSNGGQFTLPFTINQSVIIDTYSNDTTKKKSYRVNYENVWEPVISRNYGNVTEIFSK
ncbi:MAG: hypothetical protein K9H16_02625 [Bacteroidales bacterium]|nr:hypothetical protein [Bacteroidales bacterium]